MDDRLDALERLARLQQSGLLTADECAAEKQRILGQSAATKPTRQTGGTRHAIWLFVRRRKAVLAAALATMLLSAVLVYAVVTPPPMVTDGSSPAPGQTAAATSASLAGADLGDIFIGSPGSCAFGDRVRGVVGELRPMPRVRTVSVPGLPGPIEVRVEELRADADAGNAVAMNLPITGRWHGLQVTSVRLLRWQNAPIASVQIRFSDQPARAREVLNGIGFQLPEIGRLRSFEAGAADAAIGIEALSNGAALTCSFAAPATGPQEPATGNEVG